MVKMNTVGKNGKKGKQSLDGFPEAIWSLTNDQIFEGSHELKK